MGTFLVVVIVVAIIGGVLWNKRNANAAMAGVQFDVVAGPTEVTAAIQRAFNIGTAAKVMRAFGGVRVSGGGQSFRFETKIGDVGRIQLSANGTTKTTVKASTEELYVGSHPSSHSSGNGIWAFASALSHGIYKMLGVTPGAAKMKRFQGGLETKVAKQLRKSRS